MKNRIIIYAVAAMLFACEGKQRYTQQSAEIETFKSIISSYEKGDFEAYLPHYAEGAQIFFNATEDHPATIQEIIAQQKMELEALSSYSFDREKDFLEMVVDDQGETWVNFWGVWRGTLAADGKSVETPIHVTSQFVDGKIVKSHGYWDNAPIQLAIMEIQSAAADSVGSVENQQ
jgi:ketosteroid isomerase-like protein